MAERTGDQELNEVTSLGDFSVGDLVTNIRTGLQSRITKIIPRRFDTGDANPWPYLVESNLYAAHELVLIRPTGVAEIEEFLSRG